MASGMSPKVSQVIKCDLEIVMKYPDDSAYVGILKKTVTVPEPPFARNSVSIVTCSFSKLHQLPKSLLPHKMRFGNTDEITRQFLISSEVSRKRWLIWYNDGHLLFEMHGLRNFPCSF